MKVENGYQGIRLSGCRASDYQDIRDKIPSLISCYPDNLPPGILIF